MVMLVTDADGDAAAATAAAAEDEADACDDEEVIVPVHKGE